MRMNLPSSRTNYFHRPHGAPSLRRRWRHGCAGRPAGDLVLLRRDAENLADVHAAVFDDLGFGEARQNVGDAHLADLDLFAAERFMGVRIEYFLAEGIGIPKLTDGDVGSVAAVEGDDVVGFGDHLG